jgi:hypothetical protein
MWFGQLDCFLRYVDGHQGDYDVFVFEPTYLEVADSSDLMSPTKGFFASQPTRADVTDVEATVARLTAAHPRSRVVIATSNLARRIGSATSTAFNAQLRIWAKARGMPLWDIADIESHDPWGKACFDNRDGVAYTRPNGRSENYPDDGVDAAAICQHYTSEIDGGHLGAAAAGMIRLSKSFWVLAASLAGR